jgi:hypothetical protein
MERPRIVSIRVSRAGRNFGHLGIVYSRNGHRFAELGPYAYPEAAELAARDWAAREGFEVRS